MSEENLVPLRVTTKTVVSLGAEGVQLLNGKAAPPAPLTFHNLLTLSELHATEHVDPQTAAETIAAQYGASEESVRKFIRSLVVFRRLRRRPNPVASVALPPSQLVAGPVSLAKPSLDGLLAMKIPQTLRLHRGEYQLIDHAGGVLLTLSPAELSALGQFVKPVTFEQGFSQQAQLLGEHAVSRALLEDILGVCKTAGLLAVVEPDEKGNVSTPHLLSRNQAKKARFAQVAAEHDAAETARQKETGMIRPRLFPWPWTRASRLRWA